MLNKKHLLYSWKRLFSYLEIWSGFPALIFGDLRLDYKREVVRNAFTDLETIFIVVLNVRIHTGASCVMQWHRTYFKIIFIGENNYNEC